MTPTESASPAAGPGEDPEDEFRARPGDHLVEPMFAGLGVRGEDSAGGSAESGGGLFGGLRRLLRRLTGRGVSAQRRRRENTD